MAEAAGQVLPSGETLLRFGQKKIKVFHGQTRPADMGPVIAQAAHNGQLTGAALKARLFALVSGFAFILDGGQEVVRHNAAGDVPPVHQLGYAKIGEEDIAQDGEVGCELPPVLNQLVVFPTVKAELADAEMGPGIDLALQLEVLHGKLCFVVFERGNGHADIKRGGRTTGTACVESGEQVNDMDGVQVKHRLRVAAIPFLGVISGDNEKIAQTNAVPPIERALHFITVFIFAGKMADDIHAKLHNLLADDIRRQGRIPPGIIRDGDGADPSVHDHVPGQGQGLGVNRGAASPARHQFKGEGEVIFILEGTLKCRSLHDEIMIHDAAFLVC